jgi:hypothetical protein
MYLTAPRDAQARSKVHTRLLSRLSPHLVGPLTGMQWKCLPVLTDTHGTQLFHDRL